MDRQLLFGLPTVWRIVQRCPPHVGYRIGFAVFASRLFTFAFRDISAFPPLKTSVQVFDRDSVVVAGSLTNSSSCARGAIGFRPSGLSEPGFQCRGFVEAFCGHFDAMANVRRADKADGACLGCQGHVTKTHSYILRPTTPNGPGWDRLR
jgi:hypothetical protein